MLVNGLDVHLHAPTSARYNSAGEERVNDAGARVVSVALVEELVLVLEGGEERDAGRGGESGEGGRGADEADDALVVAGDEGVGGVGEEGGDRGRAVVDVCDLLGSAAAVYGCAQRHRMLADQELENGGVVVVARSAMKSHPPVVIGECQQTPVQRIEFGLCDQQLN